MSAAEAVDRTLILVEKGIALRPRPLVVGICGAQGSGKSTVAAGVARRLERDGRTAAVLSLDDLYLSRERRHALAEKVHPLLATRGVPGTHDVALGRGVIGDLIAGRPTWLPRFDKAADDPFPVDLWPRINEAVDVVLFEGWCVGAVAQDDDALRVPVNRLEAEEDGDGRWRRHVDASLREDYPPLFAEIDRLVLLAAPGFEVVARWRREQERELRLTRGGARVMTDAAVDRFVAHYERLTRHILAEMPARADLVLRLDADRRVQPHPRA